MKSLRISVARNNLNGETVGITVVLGDDIASLEPDSDEGRLALQIREKIISGEYDSVEASEAAEAIFGASNIDDVVEEIRHLSEKVTTDGNFIFYNGTRVEPVVEDRILADLKNGKDYGPVVKFLDRVDKNVSMRVREQLFHFLDAYADEDREHPFTLTKDGMIVGYKAANVIDGVPSSIHATDQYTDVKEAGSDEFVRHTGHIPYPYGCTARMDVRDVDNDPERGCSKGLHIGTWNYASHFGGGCGSVILTVEVDPANVVSVPKDYGFQKMRACEFRVIGVTENRMDNLVFLRDEDAITDDDESEESEYCYDCGDEINEEDDGYEEHLCESCFWDSHSRCEGCDEPFETGELDDDGMCEDCREHDEEDGTIHW